MIEILNENRFHKDGPKHLLSAPEPYRSVILTQWNNWLKETYPDETALRDAWKNPNDSPLGPALLHSPTPALVNGWALNDNGGKAPFTLSTPADGTLRIAPKALSLIHI